MVGEQHGRGRRGGASGIGVLAAAGQQAGEQQQAGSGSLLMTNSGSITAMVGVSASGRGQGGSRGSACSGDVTARQQHCRRHAMLLALGPSAFAFMPALPSAPAAAAAAPPRLTVGQRVLLAGALVCHHCKWRHLGACGSGERRAGGGWGARSVPALTPGAAASAPSPEARCLAAMPACTVPSSKTQSLTRAAGGGDGHKDRLLAQLRHLRSACVEGGWARGVLSPLPVMHVPAS